MHESHDKKPSQEQKAWMKITADLRSRIQDYLAAKKDNMYVEEMVALAEVVKDTMIVEEYAMAFDDEVELRRRNANKEQHPWDTGEE